MISGSRHKISEMPKQTIANPTQNSSHFKPRPVSFAKICATSFAPCGDICPWICTFIDTPVLLSTLIGLKSDFTFILSNLGNKNAAKLHTSRRFTFKVSCWFFREAQNCAALIRQLAVFYCLTVWICFTLRFCRVELKKSSWHQVTTCLLWLLLSTKQYPTWLSAFLYLYISISHFAAFGQQNIKLWGCE